MTTNRLLLVQSGGEPETVKKVACAHRWRVSVDKKGKPQAHCHVCGAPFVKANKNKYNNVVSAMGQSNLEIGRGAELMKMQLVGLITNLRTQVPFVLLPPQPGERGVKYIADFVYELPGQPGDSVDWICSRQIVEDTKGVHTRDYIIKRKLMLWVHNIKIIEIVTKKGRPRGTERTEPVGKKT